MAYYLELSNALYWRPLSRLLGPPWFAYLFDDLLDLFKAFVELGRIDVSVVGIYSNFNTVCIGWRSC